MITRKIASKQTKQISVRWPLEFWKEISKQAIDRGLSVTALVNKALAKFTGIAEPK